MKTLTINLDQNNYVSLTAYIHDKSGEYAQMPPRPAIIVLPGGGYSICSDREADPVALSFFGAGFNTFVLRYTLKTVKGWPAPLNDYERAYETIIEKAQEWGIDKTKIAVVGFSAGGHLAACAATISKHRPTAAILGYAALTKEIVDTCQPNMPIPVDCVDEWTSPCFLFATRTDNVVNISNTLNFQLALTKYGVSFESHIYSYGPHGFATATEVMNDTPISSRAENWVQDSIGWLGELWGRLTLKGYTKPVCEKRIDGNLNKHLSATCTYDYLSNQGQKVTELLSEFTAKFNSMFADNAGLITVIGKWKLVDLMSAMGYQDAEIEKLDYNLKKIKNNL